MKKILSLFKKNKDLVLVFIISVFLSSPYLIDICSGYLNFHIYDLQSFMLWDYSLAKHLLPYRDLAYAYGLLEYYKKSNIILSILYYSIAPLNFLLIFYIFKKIIKYKFLLYLSFILFYLFIFKITGFTVFARYGMFISYSLIISLILFYNRNILNKIYFYIGIILGLLFSVVNDIGIYLITSLNAVYLIYNLIEIKNNINILKSSIFYTSIIKRILLLMSGIIIGLLPLFIFLFLNNSITLFLHNFNDLRDITIVAKTPFFNYLFTKDNLFTILTLYFSIFFIIIKIFFFKKSNRFLNIIQITLIVDILILEQKSIIRSISTQITFIALILLILICYDLTLIKIKNYSDTKIKKFALILIILIFLFAIRLTGNNNDYYKINKISYNLSLLIGNNCYENNLKDLLTKNKSYIEVYKYFQTKIGPNEKIFIYPPGDSIYYILFKQIPPYITTVWNSSSANSQKTVKYIVENKIEYVLLNTNISFIADGIPDYIRAPIVYKYILLNYYPLYKIDNYIILKKNRNSDFFESNILQSFPEYRSYLLNVYLYKIPFSEGLYKGSQFTVKPITRVTINNKIHLFGNLNISSKNKIIVLIPSKNSRKNYMNYLEIQTLSDESSSIYFNACRRDKMCIINLANLPYFYKERVIKKIIIDERFEGEILIFENKFSNNFW